METLYLYNGFVMDEQGYTLPWQQSGPFNTVEAAQAWVDSNHDEGFKVVRGRRVGDGLVEREAAR